MTNPQAIFEFGRYRLETEESRLLLDTEAIALEPQVLKTLQVLVENSGHLCEKAWLIEQIWGDTVVEEGNLSRNISVLRKALGDRENGNHFIETVPKGGYRFVAPVKRINGARVDPLLKSTHPANVQKTRFEEFPQGQSLIEALPRSRIKRLANRKVMAALLVALVTVIVAGRAILNSSKSSKPISSVAVLPFINESGDPGADYLADGISEGLINSLSQLGQLKVIARSSSFKYNTRDVDPQKAAHELGVEAVVIGRIVRRDSQLQISVEIVNANDKTQVWGAQFNRPAADLQALQEQMARTISEKLRVRLTGMQERQIAKRATENPEAYQLYLNGVFYGRKGKTDDVRRSLDYFSQAIARDPDFALAYVGMAESYTILVQGSVLDPKEGMPKRKTAILKALQLDETLADAHVMVASLKGNEWDWSGAEIEYQRAISLNPNLSLAHAAYGNFLGRMGRSAEALVENKRAQELDPMRVVGYRVLEAGILRFARRYDEGLQKLLNAVEMEPNIGGGYTELGYIYAAKGMYQEAIDAYQKSMALDVENTSDQIFLGFAYAMSGRRNEALNILNSLKSTKQYVSPAELAILYVGLGDREAAFKELERAYVEHDLQLQYLKGDAHYDSLRSDPRFIDLIRRVRLPES